MDKWCPREIVRIQKIHKTFFNVNDVVTLTFVLWNYQAKQKEVVLVEKSKKGGVEFVKGNCNKN